MQGYVWAKTPDDELLVVLIAHGKGYVPGVDGAIDLHRLDILEPVKWPSQTAPQNRPSALPNSGAPAAAAMRECAILPFAARG